MSETPSKAPPYKQVADALRQGIALGDLAPGDKIETEAALADRFGHSRGTIRRAIELLKGEGLLVSRQGSGAYVRERPHVRLHSTGANYRDRRATGVSNYNAEIAAQGRKAKQRVIEADRSAAPPEVALRLGLTAGAVVAYRELVASVDDEPTQLMQSYYPMDIADGTRLLDARPIRGGAHTVLEDVGGPAPRRIVQFVEDLDVRMPTPEEATALRMPAGVPLVRTIRTAYDATGRALEVLVTRMAGDGYVFRYVIDVP